MFKYRLVKYIQCLRTVKFFVVSNHTIFEDSIENRSPLSKRRCLMRRLLLIVVLALMSGACASARPEYYLVPPVSITAPDVSETATPRPPAEHKDADVVIDDVEVTWPEGMEPEATPRPPLPVSASNNLKGKLNKGLAPYIKLDWSAGNKQSATAPVVVAKVTSTTPRPSMRNTQELQKQINNLLAQVDSLQNAELKAVQAERDAALDQIVLLKQSEAITQAKLAKVRELFAATRGGYMQWRVITDGRPEGWADDLRRQFLRWVVDLFFLGVLVLTFFFGRWRGNRKAENAAARVTQLKEVLETKNARLAASEDAIEGRNLYIKELRDSIAKKDHHITELEELVKHGFLSRNPEVEDPLESVPIESPDAVFGPLERDDGK